MNPSVDNSEPAASSTERKNFVTLVLYNVVVRTGWIFKTESIVMPAILDYIGGGNWLRGWLPLLNRLGQSIPPILLSDRIRQIKYKKRVLGAASFLMGASFIGLAIVWRLWASSQPVWLPLFFLVVYGFFWLCVGIHNLSLSLLYGKLVAVDSRGQLMLIAMALGAITAIASAWWLMGRWLSGGSDSFVWLFVFTGVSLIVAAVFATRLIEFADESTESVKSLSDTIQESVRIFRDDANFRILTLVAICFGMGITLMPHYQAYVKQTFEFQLAEFVPWVIAQNLGAALFSIPLGRLADRYGNRLALKTVMLLLCLAPALTIALVNVGGEYSRTGFYAVFFLMGLMPVAMRTFSNYTLEIAGRDDQPIYLSMLGVFMAMPVVSMSLVVGWLIDIVNFQTVFLIILSILLLGWTLTFMLIEPRAIRSDEDDSRRQRQQ